MALYAVLGNPVAHSLSPQIHQNFATQFGIDIEYRRELVEPNEFATTLTRLRDQGLKGCNITVPNKLDAFLAADHLTNRAQAAGAVNTLTFDNEVSGHNTDGDGLVRDLEKRHSIDITNKRILIIGAGGATQGILQPLMERHPNIICIANRTVEKAELLEERFKDMGCMDAYSLNEIPATPFDIIINATSLGHSTEEVNLPSSIIDNHSFFYDLTYGKAADSTLNWATKHGATASDGLGMLVEQAALSFEKWHDVSPETETIYQKLR